MAKEAHLYAINTTLHTMLHFPERWTRHHIAFSDCVIPQINNTDNYIIHAALPES